MARSSGLLRNGALSLRVDSCQAFVGKRRVNLTATECNLLVCFLRNEGEDLSREDLLDAVWGESYRGTLRTVDTHIQRLRAKLGRSGRRIRTVRGVGYRLANR